MQNSLLNESLSIIVESVSHSKIVVEFRFFIFLEFNALPYFKLETCC